MNKKKTGRQAKEKWLKVIAGDMMARGVGEAILMDQMQRAKIRIGDLTTMG